MKALNFGFLNIDMVYSVDYVVRPGETTASAELRYFCGGFGCCSLAPGRVRVDTDARRSKEIS